MTKKLAERILELFRQGSGLSEYEIENPSQELSKIVSIILSECKCSLVDENGNYIRYGSSIDINIVEKIILKLLSDNTIIPGEITTKALVKEGIEGPNIDIQFNKKYNYTTQITELEIIPIMPDNFERCLGKNNSEIQTKLMDEILKPYVKELIFSNAVLMKRSPIGAFISKSLFRKKTPDMLKQAYTKILRRYLKRANAYQQKNSIQYIVENILQNQSFKTEIINSSINSTELQMLGRVYTGFNGLVYNMITTTLSRLTSKESPNKDLTQIQDIYYTIIGVLETLTTNINNLNEKQIEEKLKIINRNFSIIPNNQYPSESLYRRSDVNKDLYGNKLKFVEPANIEKAMQNLCIRIRAVINTKSQMNNTEFIREVLRINYRFIRIQPFNNANGRTSRALINMLLQANGLSAYFEKDIRIKYIKSLTQAHELIAQNENQYVYCLINNPSECAKYEKEYLSTDIPILIVKD